MYLKIAGISLALCVCLFTTPSSQATEPSPFALPPSTDQAPPASSPGQSPPPPEQTPSSPFALPQPEPTPAQTSATDPDSAFDLPASDTGPGAAVLSGGRTPAGQASPTPTGQQTDLPAADLLARGTELARQGKYEEARISLEKALAKEPGNVLSLNNLGLVMRKLGRIEEATRSYTAAIQSNPGYALTYKNYGILLEQNGEMRRAVDAYRRYCSLAPSAPDVQKVSQRADWLAGGL